MAVAQEIVKATGSSEPRITSSPRPRLSSSSRPAATSPPTRETIRRGHRHAGGMLARVDVIGPDDEVPPGCGVTIINESVSVYLMLKGVVDPAAELPSSRRRATSRRSPSRLFRSRWRCRDTEKVPENVRADNAEKLSKLEAEVASTAAAMEDFRSSYKSLATLLMRTQDWPAVTSQTTVFYFTWLAVHASQCPAELG